jgi:hypothetical protein
MKPHFSYDTSKLIICICSHFWREIWIFKFSLCFFKCPAWNDVSYITSTHKVTLTALITLKSGGSTQTNRFLFSSRDLEQWLLATRLGLNTQQTGVRLHSGPRNISLLRRVQTCSETQFVAKRPDLEADHSSFSTTYHLPPTPTLRHIS